MGWLKKELAGKLLGTLLHRAASGEFGPVAKKAYWFTAGYKSQFALLLSVPEVGYQLVAWLQLHGFCTSFGWDCGGWIVGNGWAVQLAHVIAWAAAGFAFLGQVDGALRLDPPVKEEK